MKLKKSVRYTLCLALLVAAMAQDCQLVAAENSTASPASIADPASGIDVLTSLLEDIRGRNGELSAKELSNNRTPLMFPLDYGAHPGASAELWSLRVIAETQNGQWQLMQSRIVRVTIAPDRGVSSTDSLQGSQQDSLWRFKDIYFQSTARTLTQLSVDGTATAASFEDAQSLTRGAVGLAYAKTEQNSALNRVRMPRTDLIFQTVPTQEFSSTGSNGKGSVTSGTGYSMEGNSGTDPSMAVAGTGDASCTVDAQFESQVFESSLNVEFRSDDCPLQTTELPSMMAYSQLLSVGSGSSAGETVVGGVVWLDRAWGRLAFGSAPVVADLYRLPISSIADDHSSVGNQPGGSWLWLRVVRRANGTGRAQLSASLYSHTGKDDSMPKLVKLDYRDVEFSATGKWRSQESGLTYAAGWQLSILSQGINLEVVPVTANQELLVAGQAIWSGMVKVIDLQEVGRSAERYGFAELAPNSEEAVPVSGQGQ